MNATNGMMNDVTARLGRIAATLCACVMAVSLAGCGTGGTSGSNAGDGSDANGTAGADAPIEVISSINQWGTLAKTIGGDKVDVTSILGSTNVDAHDFEPQTSDIADLSKAQVVVANGAGYDSWATRTTGPDASVVIAADAVGAGEGDNPHLWFSKDARQAVAKELADTFSRIDPSSRDYFNERLDDWQKDEQELEQAMRDFADAHPDATYAATESVAYYLMSDLGITDVTPQGYEQAMMNDSEPAPADVQDFQSALESHQAGVLVNNPQEASDMTNMITGTAHKSDVPVVDITEQVPDGYEGLTDWLTALVAEFDKAYGDDESTEADGSSPTDDGASSDGAPTDEGQTDPLG